MELMLRWDGSVLVVAGELDIATAPDLATALGYADGSVIVDLADVPFCDGVGARTLLDARTRLLAAGGDLLVRDPPTTLRIVLAALGAELQQA